MRRHNTVGKIMLKRVESRASELCMKRCIWLNLLAKVAQCSFRVLMLRYLVLQDIKC